MKIFLRFTFVLISFWAVSFEMLAMDCTWERVKKGTGFEADVEVHVMSGSTSQEDQGGSKGKLIVAGPGVFVWMVREGLQRHLYHGDGKLLRYYYKSATASRYVRKGEPQLLEGVWVGYLDELFWQRSKWSGVRFRIKNQFLQGACQTTWVPAPETSVLPPFSAIRLAWQNLAAPLVRELELHEVGGRQVHLRFEGFRWGASFSASQLREPRFVLTHVAN